MTTGAAARKHLPPAVLRRAVLWLVFLAPFFYLTYGTANWLTSLRSDIPNLALDWEKHIPFLRWSIIPYWSVNLFYAVALFVNETPQQVDRLAKRYLTAQVIAVACFLLFPLQAIFPKPETTGLPGFMFTALGAFDKPFNQAPSLHIALLLIIWDHLRRVMSSPMRHIWDFWCLLIALSVLTTYQHHAIDIPAGLLLGLFALWLWPNLGLSPLSHFKFSKDRKALRIGSYYLLGSLLLLTFAVHGLMRTGYAIFWLWPALAFAIVAFGYFGAGPAVFQKSKNSTVSLASYWLLMPYRFFASLNIWYWTKKLPASVEIAQGVYLGRFPHNSELSHIHTVIDLTAEMIAPSNAKHAVDWLAFPSLDLLPITYETQRIAARAIEEKRQEGPVLICCALGFQRSASVAIAWLMMTQKAATKEEALASISQRGWPIKLNPAAQASI